MTEPVSIAIETSCRAGGATVGRGDRIIAEVAFDAAHRHATHLVSRVKELVERAGLEPSDLTELYVSAGPGSFTGLRIGITVARTMAQAIGGPLRERCVAVPTTVAVAHGCRELEWQNLAVLLDGGDGNVYATMFARHQGAGEIAQQGQPAVMPLDEFLAAAPKPITLVGEWAKALQNERPAHLPNLQSAICNLQSGVTIMPPDSPLHLPTARAVWEVGRRMAAAGQFTEYHRLLPIYSRQPTAVTVWEKKNMKL